MPSTIPTVPGIPILGNILQMNKEPIIFPHVTVPKYGRVVQLKLGSLAMYVVSHPADIQYVLRDNNRNYSKGVSSYPLFAVSGEALVNMEGESWLDRRRVMQPHFHRKGVMSLLALMQSALEEMFPRLDEIASTGDYIDFTNLLRIITARVFTKALYGISLSLEDTEAMSDAMYNVLNYVWQRYIKYRFIPEWSPYPGKTRFQQSRQLLHDKSAELIARRREMGKGDDLLSMLIEMTEVDDGELSPEQLHKETVSLFQGGFDTSSGTLSWVFYMLNQHPHVEQKLVEEYKHVLGDEALSAEKAESLTYTHQVIQETMRLYPTARGVLRVAIEDDQLGDYHIPAEAMVLLSFYNVHRNPNYWQSPEQFKPERFDDGVSLARSHPFAYVPFAAGPRQCIGDTFALYEMRLTIATLIQRYRIQLHPDYELQVSHESTYFPTKIMARFEKRS